jgi:hypothetical protein
LLAAIGKKATIAAIRDKNSRLIGALPLGRTLDGPVSGDDTLSAPFRTIESIIESHEQ